jgi:hypothetical protein
VDNYSRAILQKKINRLIRRGVLRGKKIVLFGASVFSREIKNCLTQHGFAISGVVDNDKRKIGTECMGIRVERPETALLPYNDSIVVLILSGGFYREMVYQLARLGYTINKQVFVLNFKTDESLPVMVYELARAVRGFVTYRRLTGDSSGHRVVFIAPYTGTGDVYLAGLFFPAYLRKNRITDYVFVVVSGACRKVAEMFDIGNIVVLKPTVTDDIINCRRFLRTKWPLVVLNDGWLWELTQWLRGYKGLNFAKVFRYFVFGFDDSARPEPPSCGDYSTEVDELLQKNGLLKGKTVVLSPYSNTLFDLPDDVWRRIVEHCHASGYTVCTNCAGTEKPVSGTPAVFFPLNQAIAFLDAAGYFIGVRSGMCDIISASSCKKAILYEKDGFFYQCSPYEYFSLEKMELCNDALEIEWRSDLKDECLREIFGAIN